MATPKKTSTAVVETKANEIVDHTALAGFADFGGAGFENVGKDDLAIPFLVILQSGSPQVKRSEGEYIEGAAEGMLFNTVTKELIDPISEDVIVVACSYQRNFVEWRLRENGGGFVKQHAPDPALMLGATRDDKGRDILDNGNQLNDTRSFYVLLMVGKDSIPAPAFITMTSTQIKKSKQWLMQQNLLKLQGPKGAYTPPMFASMWRVNTVPESNEKGSWMGWAFSFEGYHKGVTDPNFIAAQEFNKAVSSGEVKADLAKAGDAIAPGGPRELDPDEELDENGQPTF